MLNNQVNLTAKDFERIQISFMVPRGFSWVDPEKEAKADVLAIEKGLDRDRSFGGERSGFRRILKIRQKNSNYLNNLVLNIRKTSKNQPP